MVGNMEKLMEDASHTKYGFGHNIELGWVEDKTVAENSLRQLVEFHEIHPKIIRNKRNRGEEIYVNPSLIFPPC